MVCGDRIGWRENARRVIIFTTDQSFHIAGDGKLGGIVLPNDGECHLNETGFYTHSTVLDYPSVGFVNHLAKKYSVNVIWAVTENQVGRSSGIFFRLWEEIGWTSFIGTMHASSTFEIFKSW